MSLFNTIAAESEQIAEQNEQYESQSASNEPAWWLDENTPGAGNRPDWLPNQFKRTSDLAKSYQELQKKLGEAPKEYNFDAGKGWIEPDYEPFQEMANFAKSKRVPQEVMDSMLSAVGKYLDEYKIDYDAERENLGENASERLDVLNNWARSNLSESSYFALTSNLRTADAVMALEELRSKMLDGNIMIPGNTQSTEEAAFSMEDIQAELANNLDKYKSDPKYRREITDRIQKLATR